MGREAKVECQWGDEAGQCKVLLESQELIVRGAIRRRVALASLSHIFAEENRLRFRVGPDEVFLDLGSKAAQSWAKAITTPLPSLAAKLGISKTSRLLLIGGVEDEALKAATAEAASSIRGGAPKPETDLVLASIRTGADLDQLLDHLSAFSPTVPPLWIIYPKGKKAEVGETTIRERLRGRGFIDTKVASVSELLTALRFVARS